MRSIFAIVSLACALLLPPPAAAQHEAARFRHVTQADGLPETSIYRILQDRQGFVWLGTQSGLVRYDGYSFLTFKEDPDDPTSLAGRLVMALCEDRDGGLWVGTQTGGLNRLDPDRQGFTHFRHVPDDPTSLLDDAVGAVYEDRDGVLWIGTGLAEDGLPAEGGLSRLDRASGTLTHYRYVPDDPASLSHPAVTAIVEDRDGRLWVATRGGLNRFDRATGTFVRFLHDPERPESLARDEVFAFHEDAAGRLWAGTWGGGLDLLDPESETFHHFPPDLDDPTALHDGRVMAIEAGTGGELWVATRDGVVHRLDPESGVFTRYRHDPADPASLTAGNGSVALYEDRGGTLWVAVLGVGLDLLDPYSSKFLHYRSVPGDPRTLGEALITELQGTRGGGLWIGAIDGSVSRLDPASGQVERRVLAPPGDADPAINVIAEDGTGVLWVGTSAGLSRCDPRLPARDWCEIPANGAAAGLYVEDLHLDPEGKLWIATGEDGLAGLDTRTGGLVVHPPAADGRGPSALHVRVVLGGRDGVLWLGTIGGGLDRFDPRTGVFTPFAGSAGGKVIYALHEDHSGRLWAGTQNGGLHLYDPKSGHVAVFTERDGLAHDTVHAILEDDDGRLWLGTGRGLSAFDPETRTFRNYDVADGLIDARLSGGAARSTDGVFYFAGPHGIQAFSPESLEDDPHPPPVALTDLRILNESVRPAPGSPLERPIWAAREVRLLHRHRMFSLEFAALHYAHPELNRYAYRLDPFDDDWNEVGAQRQATYTNLPPGEYVFRVRAANSDGVWNEEGATLKVVKVPPWWLRPWAYLVYGAVFLGALGTYSQLQRGFVLRHAEHDRKTRELEDARALQLAMLPEEVPRHPRFEIAAFMQTATEVGGDYYDFDLRDDGTLVVAIGDAVGHGSRAGMMVTALKSLFTILSRHDDLVAVLSEAGRALKRVGARSRLHVALALVRLGGDRLEVANAGMPPVLVWRATTGKVEEVRIAGAPLGSLVGFPYRQVTLGLEPGDVVLLLSDGFPERRNADDEPLGYARVEAAFAKAARRPPAAVIEHLVTTAENWSEGCPQQDDMTFIVLEVKTSK